MTTVSAGEACPRCAQALVTVGFDDRWCPGCEWNLDSVAPNIVGWRWADRRLHGVARRLNARQFDDSPASRKTSVSRLVTMAAAVVLLAGVVAVAAAGVWLLFAPGFVAKALGVVLLALAFALRPRLGRLDEEARTVDRQAAPQLWALVERVAAQVKAPMPHVLLIGYDLNAYTATVGWKRRRVLCLGLPLWATLEPQERVALLGHELGHFVNGDVRRGLLTSIARTTLGRVAEVFAPSGGSGIVELLTRLLGWIVSRTAALLQVLLFWTSQRDSQRAEYLADELGARVAGTDAAVRLADHLLIGTAVDTVIRREARAGNGASAWRAAAATARANQAANVPLLRQVSRYTQASLASSHPPIGMRAEMLERRPRQYAVVQLDEPLSARIDAELEKFGDRVRRALAAP